MSEYNYSVKEFNKEHGAHAVGRDMDISTKHAIEIASFIRYKNIQEVKVILQNVMNEKQWIPFKRFHRDMGHKRKMGGPARYPIKASAALLKLVKMVENNAQSKGLNTSELVITHIITQKARKQFHNGRNGGRRFKRTHVEIVVEEKPKENKK